MVNCLVKHTASIQQDVDNYEYELPSDFEDEEIDEDEAFNSEDERKYGAWFERDASDGEEDDEEDFEGEEDDGEDEKAEEDGKQIDLLMESSDEEGALGGETGGSSDVSEADKDQSDDGDDDENSGDDQGNAAAAEVRTCM